MYCHLNGKLMVKKSAFVSPLSEGFAYGYGVFETLKVSDGQMMFFDEHMERMRAGCEALMLDMPYDTGMIRNYCHDLIAADERKEGALKIIISKGLNGEDVVITTRNIIYTAEQYTSGLKTSFSGIPRNPRSHLVYHKTNNYAENLLEKRRAKEKGFEEVLFVNTEGFLCEASTANLFFVRDECICTPAVSCGLLPGIMRKKVIEIAGRNGFEISEGLFARDEIYRAEEVFLTNSLMDIMPVSQIDSFRYTVNNSDITAFLMSYLKKEFYLRE